MENRNFDADVAIVGYGPTGLAAANILGKFGIKTIVLERDKDIYSRARAVTVNDWTMRCFQSIDLDNELADTMDKPSGLRWMTYDGNEVLRMKLPDSMLGRHHITYSIYQPAMEQVLRTGAERYNNIVQVIYEVAFQSLKQTEDGVVVSYLNKKTDEISEIYVKYVLGCDGGSSSVRENLGLELIGDTENTRWVVIDARVKKWWKNRNLLTFWTDKKRPVVDVAVSLGNHRWEFPLEEHESLDDFKTPEQLWPLLKSMGRSEDEIELHQHAFYKHHVRRAERWRDGRVFLLGDAAHMMPPWAGSGMQSGIRDSFNLGWKLKEVLQGNLPEQFLDSYEIERAPNVQFYSDTAVQLGKIIMQKISDEEMAVIGPTLAEDPPLFRLPKIDKGWLLGETQDSVIGKIILQPEITTADGRFCYLDEILGNDFVAIGNKVNPQNYMSQADKDSWEKLNLKYYTLLDCADEGVSENDLIDLDGNFVNWMDENKVEVIIVRPDKFVMAANNNLNLNNIHFS